MWVGHREKLPDKQQCHDEEWVRPHDASRSRNDPHVRGDCRHNRPLRAGTLCSRGCGSRRSGCPSRNLLALPRHQRQRLRIRSRGNSGRLRESRPRHGHLPADCRSGTVSDQCSRDACQDRGHRDQAFSPPRDDPDSRRSCDHQRLPEQHPRGGDVPADPLCGSSPHRGAPRPDC